MWGSTTASNDSTRCGNIPPSGPRPPLRPWHACLYSAPTRFPGSWPGLGSVLRRQTPLLLLVVYAEDAGVAGGERREQILEVAHLGSGADRDGVAVPRIQDGGRQLGAVIRVDLVRSRIGVDERKHVARLDLEDGCAESLPLPSCWASSTIRTTAAAEIPAAGTTRRGMRRSLPPRSLPRQAPW